MDWLPDLLNGAKGVATEAELWAALVGAAVGGLMTFWASWWQTRKVLRNERDMVLAATARDAAIVLLDALGTMRANLGSIGENEWRVVPGGTWVQKAERRPDPPPGVAALSEVKRHDSRAQLLPKELGDSWFELTLLLDEYRGILMPEVPGDHWPAEKLERVYADVTNYMSYLRDSLAEFVRSGESIEHCDAPILQRADLEPWTPC